MESLPKDCILEFRWNTLDGVRKIYDLDKPGRMAEAIDILDAWVKKQNHFMKKDFSRGYLERTIITTKGSLERAKSRIDKICTLRTLMPNFFDVYYDIKNDYKDVYDVLTNVTMPKLTKDFYRVHMIKVHKSLVNAELFSLYYKLSIVSSEYLLAHDYCNGFILILDYRKLNMMEFITKLNPIELRHAMTIYMEGYGMRVKGIHVITTSKVVDTFVSIFKQVLSPKVGDRIHVHKTLDTLYDYVPKEVLPSEYGGDERSISQIHDDWVEALSSKQHIEYLKEMRKACTDESCRQTDKFNEQYIGMPGTFRTLSVD